MRIISGHYRGRRLATPRGRDVRPTSDKVREATFAILGDVEGASVLDLFAGTGAMGLEALSRGAASALFVDIDRNAMEVVQRNIDATVSGDTSRVTTRKGDAVKVVHALASAGTRFDLVVFDPPYEHTRELIASTAVALPALLEPHSRIVLELSNRYQSAVPEAARAWRCAVATERRYGDTVIAVLTPQTDVVEGSE